MNFKEQEPSNELGGAYQRYFLSLAFLNPRCSFKQKPQRAITLTGSS